MKKAAGVPPQNQVSKFRIFPQKNAGFCSETVRKTLCFMGGFFKSPFPVVFGISTAVTSKRRSENRWKRVFGTAGSLLCMGSVKLRTNPAGSPRRCKLHILRFRNPGCAVIPKAHSFRYNSSPKRTRFARFRLVFILNWAILAAKPLSQIMIIRCM